jgi:general secretion pathway protein G
MGTAWIHRRPSRDDNAPAGFSLVELLIVIALLSLLAALLAPVLWRCRTQAKAAVCASHLRQIQIAGSAYMEAYDERFPPVRIHWAIGGSFALTVNRDDHEREEREHPNSLPHLLGPYAKSDQLFRCPADAGMCLPQDLEQEVKKSYEDLPHPANFRPSADRIGLPLHERFGTSYREAAELGSPFRDLALADVREPAAIFFAADASGFWHPKLPRRGGCEEDDPYRATTGERWNLLAVYLDGHIQPASFPDRLWKPYRELLDSGGRR